jgi:hypothetical protein
MPGDPPIAGGVYRRFFFSHDFSLALGRLPPDGAPDPTFNGECTWR